MALGISNLGIQSEVASLILLNKIGQAESCGTCGLHG